MSKREIILVVLLSVLVVMGWWSAYHGGLEQGVAYGTRAGMAMDRDRYRLMLRDSAEKAVQGRVDGTQELVRLYNAAMLETEK